ITLDARMQMHGRHEVGQLHPRRNDLRQEGIPQFPQLKAGVISAGAEGATELDASYRAQLKRRPGQNRQTVVQSRDYRESGCNPKTARIDLMDLRIVQPALFEGTHVLLGHVRKWID